MGDKKSVFYSSGVQREGGMGRSPLRNKWPCGRAHMGAYGRIWAAAHRFGQGQECKRAFIW